LTFKTTIKFGPHTITPLPDRYIRDITDD